MVHLIIKKLSVKDIDFDLVFNNHHLTFETSTDHDETFYSIKDNPNLELTFNGEFIIIPRIKVNNEHCVICQYFYKYFTDIICMEDCLGFPDYCDNAYYDDKNQFYYKTFFLHKVSKTTGIVTESYRLNNDYFIWKSEDYNAIIDFLIKEYPMYNTIFNIMLNDHKNNDLAFKKIKLNGTYKMYTLIDDVTKLLTKKEN